MPDERLVELAHIAGVNPVQLLGQYAWERLTKKKAAATVGTVAAACLVGALLGVATPSRVEASSPEVTRGPGSLAQHYRKLIADAMRRLFGRARSVRFEFA